MKDKGWIVYLLFLAGLFLLYFLSGWIYFLFLLLLGFIYFGYSLLFRFARIPLERTLFMPEEIEKKRDFHLRLTCKNLSILPGLRLKGRLALNNVLLPCGKEHMIDVILFSKELRHLEIPFNLERIGCYRGEIPEMFLGDPLGLFWRPLSKVSSSQELMVYASSFPLTLHVAPSHYEAEEGEMYQRSFIEAPQVDILGVKSYRRGDSYKLIHWKLSAKLNEFMVKEIGIPQEARLLLLLENNQRFSQKLPQAEQLLIFYLNMAGSLIERGYNLVMAWYDEGESSLIFREPRDMEAMIGVMTRLFRSRLREQGCNFEEIKAYLEKENFSHYIYFSPTDQAPLPWKTFTGIEGQGGIYL